MKLRCPPFLLGHKITKSDLISMYAENAFVTLQKTEVTDEYQMGNTLSSCRDGFLNDIHKAFSKGEKEILCALCLPDKPTKEYEKGQYPPHPDLITRHIYNRGWRDSFPIISIEDAVFWGIVTIKVLLFTVTNKTYFDPVKLWLFTQDLRTYVTGFSKIKRSSKDYDTPQYTQLCGGIRNNSLRKYDSQNSNYSYEDVPNDSVLSYHSPLNIINTYTSLYYRLISLYKNPHFTISKNVFGKETQSYDYSSFKLSIDSMRKFHKNINLESIMTPMGVIKLDVLEAIGELVYTRKP